MKKCVYLLPLFLLVFGCKTQKPPEPRYVDYVPFFDHTGLEFLKSPSPKGAELDTLVCIWSNIRKEKVVFNETLFIEHDFEPPEANLIIDLELINEKPPLFDTLSRVTRIRFTANMVDTYFPVISDSFKISLLFEQLSPSSVVIKSILTDSTLLPLVSLPVTIVVNREGNMELMPVENTHSWKGMANIGSPSDTAIVAKTPKNYYTRDEIMADSTRDLADAHAIMDGVIADLGYTVGDTIPYEPEFQSIKVDSFLCVETDTVIVEVFDSSRIVKQRPLDELMEETVGKLTVKDTIRIRGDLEFIVFHPDENDVFIDMVRVRGGTFQMGSNEFGRGEITAYSGNSAYNQNQRFDEDERPAYSIDVSGFLISKYEITNTLYATFMSLAGCDSLGNIGYLRLIDLRSRDTKIYWDKREGRFIPEKGYENYPVVNVTWDGAQFFCNFMRGGRLPSEAEWEYAAKGGIFALKYYTDQRIKSYDYYQRYAGGNNLAELGWFVDNSRGYCHKVGGKKPNLLGIHDMCGNVWEWCYDKYNAEFYKRNNDSHDPMCLTGPDVRVNRGGSWSNDAMYCRVTNRNYLRQGSCNKFLGFRYMRK
ncbi:MAG: formylglycine-generating enzyme family protein [Prolixibacteraceae bacterium]|nr:formylglycine-generating enzyme family protein [Prolixibacteraceae bacterium]